MTYPCKHKTDFEQLSDDREVLLALNTQMTLWLKQLSSQCTQSVIRSSVSHRNCHMMKSTHDKPAIKTELIQK